jgi:hypothetical protein
MPHFGKCASRTISTMSFQFGFGGDDIDMEGYEEERDNDVELAEGPVTDSAEGVAPTLHTLEDLVSIA